MRLDAATRGILENVTRSTTKPPGNWSASWVNILMKLFPLSQNYAVCPQKRIGAGDLIIEVAKVTLPENPSERHRFRIVLVVEIKDP
jgi:hypothetical protein